MDEDALNLEVRKFLKRVGISAQRAIEDAVRDGVETGKLQGNEQLKPTVSLEVPELGVRTRIDGEIQLK